MDLGDLIFFIIFVVIIISNILKHLKKSGKQTSEKEKPEKQAGGDPPPKKSGWKNMLEQMLEEARKQMENSAEPESTGKPLKHPTGWEDLISGSEPAPEKLAKRPPEAKVAKTPRQPIIIHDDPVRDKVKFRPECMRCNEPMKEITDLGTGKQRGLIYCDKCGEQHKYQILNGELKLKRTEAIRKKSVIAPERNYQKAGEKHGRHAKVPVARREDAALPAEEIKISRQLSREGLRNAVVWSEILGKPLGLRDMEV